jgi:glucans biosynthesis protein C
MGSAVPTTTSAGRRYQALDLMRAAVVAGLILHHTALIFDPGDYYVNNRPPSASMTIFVFFTKLWGMPLLFLIAGGSVWHSLGSRSTGPFVRERLSRLLLPLAVGLVLVVPPQIYYSMRAHGQDPGSYWEFLGQFFKLRDNVFETAHLWFLAYLLLYSLLLLPVFLLLRRGSMRWALDRVAAHGQRPWGILLLALPIALLEASLGIWGPGGWNSYAYLFFLFLGFLLSADRRLGDAIRQRWKQALVVGVSVLPALFVIAHFDLGGAGRVLGSDYQPWSVVWRLLRATAGVAWTLAIFGFITRLLGRPPAPSAATPPAAARAPANRLLRYANEAVLPFYILHQAPIVIIGFYVVQWRVGFLAKYVTISVASLACTLLLYDLCVRRTSFTRALFGMPRTKPEPAASVSLDLR